MSLLVQRMSNSSHTSRQVPLPVLGSKTVRGREEGGGGSWAGGGRAGPPLAPPAPAASTAPARRSRDGPLARRVLCLGVGDFDLDGDVQEHVWMSLVGEPDAEDAGHLGDGRD